MTIPTFIFNGGDGHGSGGGGGGPDLTSGHLVVFLLFIFFIFFSWFKSAEARSSPLELARLGTGIRKNNIDIGTVRTNPGGHTNAGGHSVHRERLYINLNTKTFDKKAGYIETASIGRIPRRLILMMHFVHHGTSNGYNQMAFTVDILLVPISFNVKSCYDLYLNPMQNSEAPECIRGLRDNIILLRRIAHHLENFGFLGDQWDVPEQFRNSTDYRLVVTCPALYKRIIPESEGASSHWSNYAVLELLLEMEVDI